MDHAVQGGLIMDHAVQGGLIMDIRWVNNGHKVG